VDEIESVARASKLGVRFVAARIVDFELAQLALR